MDGTVVSVVPFGSRYPIWPWPPSSIGGALLSLYAIIRAFASGGMFFTISRGVEPVPPKRLHCCPSGTFFPSHIGSANERPNVTRLGEGLYFAVHPVNNKEETVKTNRNRASFLNMITPPFSMKDRTFRLRDSIRSTLFLVITGTKRNINFFSMNDYIVISKTKNR
jgi:hypothetical protein